MRDPNEILLMSPSDDEDENGVYEINQANINMPLMNYHNQAEIQYRNAYQGFGGHSIDNNDIEEPTQMPVTYSQHNFGYNPESLYSQNEDDADQFHYSGKENVRNYASNNIQNTNAGLKKTKQKFHDRLSKHRFVSESGNKKWNRSHCGNNEIKSKKMNKKKQNDQFSTYMNPTIARQLNWDENAKVKPRAKRVIDEVENKMMAECSFKPEINQYDGYEEEITQEERWRRLLEPKTGKIQKLEKAKFERERKQIEQTWSFKPNIRKQDEEEHQKVWSKKQVVDRLHYEANKREEKREKLKRKVEEERMKDWSFKPNIHKDQNIGLLRTNSNRRPIYERVDDVQKHKDETLRKLRVEAECQNENLKFKPKVNKVSEKLVNKRIQKKYGSTKNINVVERLTRDASDRIEKKNKDDFDHEISEMHPFQPKLSTFSNMSHNKTMYNLDNKNFYERQQEFLQKQHERREAKRNEEGKQFSFKPKINTTSDIIVEADPQRAEEWENDKFNRLYAKDFHKVEAKKEAIKEELYGKFTYKPHINQLSKLMAADRTYSDLVDVSQNKSTLTHDIHHELNMQKVKECTFKPKINKNYKGVTATYANKEDMKAMLKEKARQRRMKYDQEVNNKQYEEIKDCTFKPNINSGVPKTSNEIVVVRGLGRYMELQELASKKTKDQLEREAQVFGLGHKFAPNVDMSDIYTIPEPFELSYKQSYKSND